MCIHNRVAVRGQRVLHIYIYSCSYNVRQDRTPPLAHLTIFIRRPNLFDRVTVDDGNVRTCLTAWQWTTQTHDHIIIYITIIHIMPVTSSFVMLRKDAKGVTYCMMDVVKIV